MTPRKLTERLYDLIADEEANTDVALTVPALLHIRQGLLRSLDDAITDERTPCEHTGTRWQPEGSPFERCGQCGRVIEEIKV